MDKEKKSIFLIASLGFGIRNFLMGKFLNYLSPHCHIHLFSNLSQDENFLKFAREKNITVYPLLAISPDKKWRIFKSLRSGLHVAYLNNETWKLKQSDKHHFMTKKEKIKLKTIMFFLRIISNRYSLRLFDKLESTFALKSKESNYYRKIFEEVKPSLVFSTCPLVSNEWLPIQVAREMGIKTAIYILSWDNLSTKERPPLPVDNIFLWNERMLKELLTNYPGAEKAQLFISGSPQFDFYFDEDYIESKENFFKRFNLDLEKKLIVYSGVTPSLMPKEEQIVERLIKDLKEGKIEKKSQLLVRLHPKDDGRRYENIMKKYPEVVFSIPGKANEGNIYKWVPDEIEIKNLVNIVRHCDVLINVASTMTIDSAILDRPVINVRYYFNGKEGKPPWGIFIYETTHYKQLVPYVKIANSPEELIKYINFYLQNPQEDFEKRKKIVDLVCGKVDGNSGKKIAEKILNIIQ